MRMLMIPHLGYASVSSGIVSSGEGTLGQAARRDSFDTLNRPKPWSRFADTPSRGAIAHRGKLGCEPWIRLGTAARLSG